MYAKYYKGKKPIVKKQLLRFNNLFPGSGLEASEFRQMSNELKHSLTIGEIITGLGSSQFMVSYLRITVFSAMSNSQALIMHDRKEITFVKKV